jgi:hypothetical protein
LAFRAGSAEKNGTGAYCKVTGIGKKRLWSEAGTAVKRQDPQPDNGGKGGIFALHRRWFWQDDGCEGVARFMGVQAKRALVWVAAFAIALQSTLAPFGPPAAQAANIDPFTVICHNGASDTNTPNSQQGLLALSCDHCVLCNATPVAAAPHDVLALGPMRVQRNERLPFPRIAAALIFPVSAPNLARGPPQIA